MLEAHAFELQRLSEFLSEDHDLVVLRTSVLEQAKLMSQLEDGEGLIEIIGLRREQLQKKAIALAARLYAEEPESFVGRFQTYWHEWRPNIVADVNLEVETQTQAPPVEPPSAKASAAQEPGS